MLTRHQNLVWPQTWGSTRDLNDDPGGSVLTSDGVQPDCGEFVHAFIWVHADVASVPQAGALARAETDEEDCPALASGA